MAAVRGGELVRSVSSVIALSFLVSYLTSFRFLSIDPWSIEGILPEINYLANLEEGMCMSVLSILAEVLPV